jgi:hypothetical protein
MKKSSKKPEETTELSETFFLTFIGELVEVAGSFYHENVEVPITIQGYILDTDKDYYFMGDTPEEITRAIRKDSVIYIQVIEDIDPLHEALKDCEVPEDERLKN